MREQGTTDTPPTNALPFLGISAMNTAQQGIIMQSDSGFFSLPDLARKLAELRSEGKRIVLCHGVFDLLHIGHIRYLRQAKRKGDILVVTLTPDRFVDKGPHRPAFTEQLRAEALISLDCVDFVAINMWPTAEETLRMLKPQVYAKGAEFKNLEDSTGKIIQEAKVCEEENIDIFFVDDITFSSSTLINRHLNSFSKDCQEYIDLFRKRHSEQEIVKELDAMAELTVLVVGDTILDEYLYCSALGASSKDPVLAMLHQSQDLYAGGAAAVANHLAQHVRKVIFCTIVGDDNQEGFIRSYLAPNVEMYCALRPSSPTVRKVRIVDSYSFQKMLEVYHMNRNALEEPVEKAFTTLVGNHIRTVDMVVAADFGNGCISARQVEYLCANAPFLAVNTQANAGNRGYHTIERYRRADFVSLASHELTMQFRNRNLTTGEMLIELARSMNTAYVLVTEGRSGCAIYDNDAFMRMPSFASSIVDRVGAGDALFAITSLAAFKHLPADLIAFLGNISGSLAVGTMGNAKAMGRDAILRYITSVLK